MGYKSFEELDVWKKACQLSVQVYDVIGESRDFAIRDQITRSALSIASNIAEGAERNSRPDFVRFVHVAKGSAAELRTQLYIASKIGVISVEQMNQLVEECKGISAMLQALARGLSKSSK